MQCQAVSTVISGGIYIGGFKGHMTSDKWLVTSDK
jgi:hypothetical protein